MIDISANAQFEQTERWLAPPFGQFTRDVKRLYALLNLTINGVQAISEMPRIATTIIDLEKSRGIPNDPAEMEMVEAEAELAMAERDDGFPLTYSQFLIALWAMLEALIRKFTAKWLEHEGIDKYEAVLKLRVRIGDYHPRTEEQRSYLLVQLLEREEASSLKSGSDRFESLLKCISLDGPLPRKLKRTLFELSQLRNCAVHNGLRADETLAQSCPWLAAELGELIRLDRESVEALFKSVMDYSALVLIRAAEAKGHPMKEASEEIAREWEANEISTQQPGLAPN